MRFRYVLAIWAGVFVLVSGLSIWLAELSKKYGQLRVFNDMTATFYWLMGAGAAFAVVARAMLAVHAWRGRKRKARPEKPWVARQ